MRRTSFALILIRPILTLTCITILFSVIGCSGSSDDAQPTKPAGVEINNSAPEAKTAPAAPGPGPSVPRPGGGPRGVRSK